MPNPELPFDDRPPEEGFSTWLAIKIVDRFHPQLEGTERYDKIDEVIFVIEDWHRAHDAYMLSELSKPPTFIEGEGHG